LPPSATPPSMLSDPSMSRISDGDDSEMFEAIERLENYISDSYWEVVTGQPPNDESAGIPAPKSAD
jgi:hypothetical protein